MTRLRLWFGLWMANFTRKLRNDFYLYLAALLTLLVLLGTSLLHAGKDIQQHAFDFMVRHRIIVQKADADIVIIDINETSLATMAAEYGKWPWPRKVFGEFLENIEAQRPKAVIFDLAFNNADLDDPAGDSYFNDIIADTGNTFFSLLRLPAAQDKQNGLSPTLTPSITQAVAGKADPEATIAMVLPYADAAIRSRRLGVHNIHTDSDGIVRGYRVYDDNYGWRLPSLALAVARTGQYPLPVTQDILLNWRGGPFSYKYASFSDIYHDMSSKENRRPSGEFSNKTVIVGSTAPGLSDRLTTPLTDAHPSAEILATAIDNIKNADYLRTWGWPWSYITLSLLLLWLTAAAFYFNVERRRLTSLFVVSQIGLLALSYIGINALNFYLDFTAPVIWAIVYFAIAKLYAMTTGRSLQRWLAFGVKPGETGTQVLIMPISIDSDQALGDARLRKLKRQIELASRTPSSIETLGGRQQGVWALFSDIVVVSWVYSEARQEYASSAHQDASNLAQQLPSLLASIGLGSTPVRHSLLQASLSVDRPLANQWRNLFAQAILRLETSVAGAELKKNEVIVH